MWIVVAFLAGLIIGIAMVNVKPKHFHGTHRYNSVKP